MRTRIIGTIMLAIGIVAGCTFTPAPLPDRDYTVDSTTLSFDLILGAERWEREVQKRYPDALVVMVHGRTDEQSGQWYAYPSVGQAAPVRELVASLRVYYPDRRIVLVVCNPDGKRLTGVDDVSYARENVWVIPDDQTGFTVRDLIDPEAVGSIWEFQEQ